MNLKTFRYIKGMPEFIKNKLTGVYRSVHPYGIKYTWYRFINHRWNKMDNLDELYTMINEICKKEIIKIGNEMCERNDLQTYLMRIDILNKIMKNPKRNPYGIQHDVITGLTELLYDPQFLYKLDTNTKLICFTNGVYDLSSNTFRDGRPDDYISCGVNYDYNPNIGKNSELNMFFKQIQPNKEVRKYLKKVLSKTLVGSAEGDLFILVNTIETGEAVQSSLIKLLHETLDDLSGFMESKHLPNVLPLQSDQFRNMVNIMDKLRACFIVSNCSKSQINFGFLNIIPDMMRSLYLLPPVPNGATKFYSVLFMEMNCLDKIICIEDENGTWQRIKVIPFMAENVSENVSKNFQNWRQYMMNKMIKYYNLGDLPCPHSVIDLTQKYRIVCKNSISE
ncbi:MAG: D5-ATPase-helicase [Satyrvirus sp.]|uniref:D5-ATPase-helicase n=1 Tax=Satyrvirus sp. TaxID=2487771 RepID=A0A3G5AFW1_9VIRU|nr:MAG: D5-ATPase-helicase [Satyrvirus sp.]